MDQGVGLDGVDYVDLLLPGYRFSPTDYELIVDYLIPKIQKQLHHTCRFYDVNIYDYHPKQLAETYRACGNKWYFWVPRDLKYPNGKRPNRQTKENGTWKATQKYDIENSDGQKIGLKRSLFYKENHGNKTEWLMYEYTATQFEMSDIVLCKIYKKETSETNKRPAIQDKNTRINQQENNQEPSPIRRKISGNQLLQDNSKHTEPRQKLQINLDVDKDDDFTDLPGCIEAYTMMFPLQ